MNASAKFTAFVLFAGAALGAAAWSGCTTGSSTNNDTDGGNQPVTPGDDDDDASTGTPTPDAGPTCDSKQDPAKPIRDATCQACLNANCCTQMKTCYDIVGDTAAGKVDCNDYNDCVENCNTTNGGETCTADCDLTAQTGVDPAYAAIAECGNSKCATECQ